MMALNGPKQPAMEKAFCRYSNTGLVVSAPVVERLFEASSSLEPIELVTGRVSAAQWQFSSGGWS